MSASRTRRSDERKFVDVVLGSVEQDGTFSGYASLFGRVDLGKDLVERGAFSRSLKERGTDGIRMLYQHDPGEPIGTWTELREDSRGLFVRGRLSTETVRGREVHALLRSGALDGLSIGFRTVTARRDSKTGVRRIFEADLWEISVVTFPMLPGARVETVKGRRAAGLPTTRTFTHWLINEAGLSRSQARTVIHDGFASLSLRRKDAASPPALLANTIRQATRMINRKRTSRP